LPYNLTQIWEKVCDGDPASWQKLVHKYAALVYSVAKRTGLSDADAEDCSQQTWLTLYRKRNSIKDPKAIPSWLIKTTHRHAVKLAQQLNRLSTLEQSDVYSSTDPIPIDEIVLLEQQVLIQDGLRELEPRCRKLLTELYFSDPPKSYKEISRIMGVNQNNIGPMRSRCLEKLKKMLKKIE
jgi:RNA polymerase sigma factor (sigma-70 family)